MRGNAAEFFSDTNFQLNIVFTNEMECSKSGLEVASPIPYVEFLITRKP
jgi:hypothetical protein